MPRINEIESAQKFINRAKSNEYIVECSHNAEIDYKKEKEKRDTVAVKRFTQSKVFKRIEEIN